MLKAELKVIGGKQSGNRIALPPKFLIGREQDCQLRPNSDLVSRHHCMFTLDDYTLRLRDLGSTNGTLVNDELLEGQIVLKSGDLVRVGNLEFEVVIRESSVVAGSGEQDFVPDQDSRIISAKEIELPTSETLVDVVLPHPAGSEVEGETESFAGGAEASGSDTDTMPTYPPSPQPGYPVGMPPQGYYPSPPPGYYPPQGMPYPPPGYPQYYPMQPGYAPPQSAAPPEAPSSTQTTPDVRLPDPSETGVKDVSPGSGQGKSGDEPNPSDKANELLNKMRTRR